MSSKKQRLPPKEQLPQQPEAHQPKPPTLRIKSYNHHHNDDDAESIAFSEIYTKDDMEIDNVSSTDDDEQATMAPPPSSSSSSNNRSPNPPPESTLAESQPQLPNSPRTGGSSSGRKTYSVRELVATLSQLRSSNNSSGNGVTHDLPPELERRVLDFSLAQRKRRDKYGVSQPWGIFGMYAHLDHVRIDLEWAEDAAWRRQEGKPYLAWSDFEEVRLKSNHRPWFTYAFIAICTVMMLVLFSVNDWKVEPLSVNLMIGPSRETLIKVGARDTVLIVEEGQWFRLFTPLVLHAGIIHYVINMLAFWFIGAALETSHGVVNTIALFLIPGVGGNILSAIFLPQFISVGASGGIFGLIGGCVADIGLNWSLLFIKNGDETSDRQVYRRNFIAVFILVVEIMVNVLMGLVTPVIDNWSHIGGFFYGACCALSTIEPLAVSFFGVNSSAWAKIRSFTLRFGGLMLSMVLILVSTVALATMADPRESPCNSCRYISCVPFPIFQEDKWWYCDDCDFVTADLYKSGNGTSYSFIELTCPDESVETVDVYNDSLTEKDDVRQKLPTYCREHCDSVFK